MRLHSLLQFKSLTRLIAGATLGLTLLTVVAVAQTPPDAEVSALSSSPSNLDPEGDITNTGASSSTAGTPGGSTAPSSGTSVSKAATTSPRPSSAVSSKTSGTAPATGSITASPSAKPNQTPSSSPPATPAGTWKYPLHSGIKTTWFYSGEPASADNDFIQNVSSAWQDDWQSHFGGSDNPSSRCGYNPCGFTPHENPFYFALPFSDYTNTGPVADLSMVYWKTGPVADGTSILKNRWIQITAAPGGTSKTVYAQWEDVGPFNEHDNGYVFGSSVPASTRAGLDISPATRDYLGMGGSTTSSWRFVDYSEVPAGPWKTIITSSGPDWN